MALEPLRLAQILGITTTAVNAGLNLSFSFFTVPLILQSPAPLCLKQWTGLYNTGIKVVPPLAVAAGGIWGFLAYEASKAPAGSLQAKKFWPFVTAGVLSSIMIPYTVAFMASTNNKLLGMGELSAQAVLKEQSIHQLVDWWGVLNLGRGTALLAGALVGAWTIIN